MHFKFKFDRHFYLLLIFFRSIAFWITWLIFRPEMPFSAALIYRERGQDIEYLPQMAGIGTDGLRDAFDFIHHGEFFTSFPPGSIWLHSLLYKFIGIPGFILADFCVATVVFLLLSKLMKEFKINDFIANTISLFVVIGASGKINGLSKGVHIFLGHENLIEGTAFAFFAVCAIDFLYKKVLPKTFLLISGAILFFLTAYENWEYFAWRFPRPFVTEAYFLSFAIVALKLNKLPNFFSQRKYWFALGIVFGFLLESEIYRFFLCGLLMIPLTLSKIDKRIKIKEVFTALICLLLPLTALSIPFVLQRVHEHSDVPLRFGAFSVSRLHPFFTTLDTHVFFTITLIIVLFIFVFLQFHEQKKQDIAPAELRTNIIALFWLYIFTLLSLPLFMIFSGKLIQPEHFNHQMKHMLTLITLIGIGLLLMSKLKANWMSSKKVPLYCLIGLVAIINIAKDTHKSYTFTDHTRSDFGEYKNFPHYLTQYADLLKELETQNYPQSLSLATLDMQVIEWWNAYKHGYSFLSDVNVSPLSDDELEVRVMTLAHLLQFSPEEFIAFINEPMMRLFFISCLEYRFSKGYLYSKWEDYTPEDHRSYNAKGEFQSFLTVMPISERKRLIKKYIHLSASNLDRLPDLIILQTHPRLTEKTPPSDLYQLNYSNSVFRVWKILRK